jgi:urocanate hydratase
MSGAQAKATTIGGGICLVAEINEKPLNKRHEEGYLDEKYSDLDQLIARVKKAKANKEAVSIGYLGNTVDMWEKIAEEKDIIVELGSDQSSLHNPYFGGYYPAGLSYEESNIMMVKDPSQFKAKVEESLRR